MAVIFNLLIESAATIAKIPLLPQDVRDGISKVTNALKAADSKIKSVTFNQFGLSSVIKNWLTVNAAVRLIPNVGPGAADAMATARDAVYNAVAGQAGIIQKAFTIFFPPAGAAVPPPATIATSFLNQISALNPKLFTQVKSGAVPGAAPSAAKAKYPSGSIARFNVKRKVWSIYVPIGAKTTGLGIFDMDGSCLYGDCGLGADEPPPGTTKGGEEPAPTDPGSGQALPQDPNKEGIPLYKKPLFWVAVAGGVVVVGGGGYWIMRRRKKAA
jgi:hypothetical protein